VVGDVDKTQINVQEKKREAKDEGFKIHQKVPAQETTEK
jgi:hypothetical protein